RPPRLLPRVDRSLLPARRTPALGRRSDERPRTGPGRRIFRRARHALGHSEHEARRMNFGAVEGVARALLYEGYLLYPYRASSVTNAKRWTFGSLYPTAYAEGGRERSRITAEVLVTGEAPTISARAVFLVSCERTLGESRRVEAVERRADLG